MRLLAISDKMFNYFTIVTFVSLCCLFLMRLVELFLLMFMLHLWFSFTTLLDHIKIHWVTSITQSDFSFLFLCLKLSMFHSLFLLLTVNVDWHVNYVLKINRSLYSRHFVFYAILQFSVVLWCESIIVSLHQHHYTLKFHWVLDHWSVLL